MQNPKNYCCWRCFEEIKMKHSLLGRIVEFCAEDLPNEKIYGICLSQSPSKRKGKEDTINILAEDGRKFIEIVSACKFGQCAAFEIIGGIRSGTME